MKLVEIDRNLLKLVVKEEKIYTDKKMEAGKNRYRMMG